MRPPSTSEISRNFRKDELELFWNFVVERQAIWSRRFLERKPAPWTDDQILATNKFTNVYRELDPGTQYAITEILERPVAAADRVFNVMLYRLLGKAETHRTVGFQRLDAFDAEDLRDSLQAIKDSGQPVFTAAYIVSGYQTFGSSDKISNVATIFRRIADTFPSTWAGLLRADHPEKAFSILSRLPGFGRFLSYQVLVDLCYPLRRNSGRGLLPFSNDDWAAAGPGAKRGLQILLGYTSINELEAMRWLRDSQADEFRRHGLAFKFLQSRDGNNIPLSLANIQNCLCEFHKYVKIRNGTGRARRRYNPAKAIAYQRLPEVLA